MSRRASSSSAAVGSVTLRRRVLLLGWLLAGSFLLFRAVELQVVQGAEWRAEAERQHRMQGEVVAARGAILDRDGAAIALSHETFRVSVAPHELSDRDHAATLLEAALDLTRVEATRVVESDRRWIPLPGRHPPAVREALGSVRGVYVERELRRFYPHDALARSILGTVIDEEGAGGIEQQFDGHLRGTPGMEIRARDSEGRSIPGETWLVDAPRSGGSVVLTLDVDLQEIAQEALRDAIATTGAAGGDLLVTDPRSGEILAMVSLKDGVETHLGSINTPYEPGSTLKPFTVATLLREGHATMADTVDTGAGRWTAHGRTITDVHSPGRVTLSHALRVSSNVGVAMLAERMSPAEQYEGLRDFGFGVPTGVSLPGEATGTLRRPQEWSRQSPASLAIGYEIAVTPLQMAMAYGALANGGSLMEPRIIREIRDPDGAPIERFEPRVVRRVIPPDVAAAVNRSLVEAVEDGTGTQARLASFSVAGKSGTSRAYGVGGGYESGAYYSSFVGFFPAEAPQLVVFVKLERPQGAYYGGATAAPVIRTTMEAVLAARRPPLDRQALTAVARAQQVHPTVSSPVPVRSPGPIFASLESAPPVGVGSPGEAGDARMPGVESIVPDIRGLPPRVAARRLHAMGFSVIWEAGATVRGTDPAAGSLLQPGDTVRVLAAPAGGGSAGPPGRAGDD